MKVNNIVQYDQTRAIHAINLLDRNELEELRGEIYGSIFWYKKGASFNTLTSQDAAFLNKLDRKLKARIKSGKAKPELTKNGSVITRSGTQSDCAYTFFNLFHSGEKGWSELYSPAPYHVAWSNRSALKVLVYCEGSVTELQCPDESTYITEVWDHIEWYQKNY